MPRAGLALLLALATATLAVAVGPAFGAPAAGGEPPPLVLGREIEVRGEIVEIDCYLREGKRGEAHRSCALACLAHGGSLALVEDDTGTLYPFAGDTPASDPNARVRDLVAQHVIVAGRLYERGRGRVLVVHEVHRLD